MNFSNINRTEFIHKLKNQTFDVLIIGGGITGAGVALDAASRGMETALVEMKDFSSGTSSRSTKLIHGGLRYLKQFQVKMVAEVGKERTIVYENGPHVTSPEWMLLPLYKGGTFGRLSTSIGLQFYDFLAGVKGTERRKMLSRAETLQVEPLIRKEGLLGAGYYVEYRTDDARLTIEVMKAAFDYGAIPLNYTKVVALKYDNNQIMGVIVKDQFTGEVYEILAKEIINSTGPWVDNIRELDHSKTGKMLKLTKGVHIVVSRVRFPLKNAVYFDIADKRMIFAIPRGDKVYAGTTDTFYDKDLKVLTMTPDECRYIINALNTIFPSLQLTAMDIESSWAGVRPLIFEEGKQPSEISRRDEIWESSSGLITIAGGKLTGYRKMAETVVNLVAKRLEKATGKLYKRCQTRKIFISGGDVGGSSNLQQFIRKHMELGESIGLSKSEAAHITSIYGSNTITLFEMKAEANVLADKFNLPIVLVLKLLYGIRFELVATPVDFFFRRSGDLLFHIDQVKMYKKQVVYLMSLIFNWNNDQEQHYLSELQTEIIAAAQTNQNKW
jgi:glycerol-3-phosphate dehydrogenase